MSHVYHDALPGYHPEQVLHDGCDECEERSRMPIAQTIGWLDDDRFALAWQRATRWKLYGLSSIALAEVPLLDALWAVQVRLQRLCDLPLGELPAHRAQTDRRVQIDPPVRTPARQRSPLTDD